MAIWCAALNDLMHCLHVSPDQRRLGLWDASILLEPFVPEVAVQIDEQQRHCDKQERRQHICELASTLPTSRIKTSDVCRKREREREIRMTARSSRFACSKLGLMWGLAWKVCQRVGCDMGTARPSPVVVAKHEIPPTGTRGHQSAREMRPLAATVEPNKPAVVATHMRCRNSVYCVSEIALIQLAVATPWITAVEDIRCKYV